MRLFLPRSPRRSPVVTLVRVSVLALALGACALTVVQGQAAQPGRRIVAVGDVHGDYETFVRVLQQVGLLDEDLGWSGGDATLVQTGDFTDKGDDVRAVMDLLMRLQDEAATSGGEVVVLLGNHEILNFVGELRQGEVTPEIVGSINAPPVSQATTRKWDLELPRLRAAARVAPQIPAWIRVLAAGRERRGRRWSATETEAQKVKNVDEHVQVSITVHIRCLQAWRRGTAEETEAEAVERIDECIEVAVAVAVAADEIR